MKREHTLRYLLLRHLRAFADRVPRDLSIEVTHSLRVVAERDRYVVSWHALGVQHERIYQRDDFVFYRRGDTAPERRTLDEPLADQNSARARAFGVEVFGVPAPPPETGAREPRQPFGRYGVVEAVALGVATRTIGGLDAAAVLALVGLYLVEYVKRGRLWASALFLMLALLGPQTAALLGALSYGLLQLLDPDPTDRYWRVALCATAATAAGAGLAFAGPRLVLNPATVAVAAAALGGAVARSLYAAHLRAMPLVLPFYALGLYLDGYSAASLVGLSVTLVSILFAAYGYRWAPVQRERLLTPNG